MTERERSKLTVPCSHCGAPVTAEDRYCGACGGALVLEAAPPAPEPEPEPERWRPRGREWLVACGGALALLVFGAALAMEIRGGEDDTAQALNRPRQGTALAERFVVTHWRAVPGVVGVVILGEVRNDNPVAAGVQLQIIARGASGRVVDNCEYWPAGRGNIAPGGTHAIGVVATDQPAVTFEVRIIDAHVW